METLKQYLYQEVISKAKYDKLIGKKIIHPEDYLFLDLNKEQLKILESLCQKYDIILEILPPKISNEETKNLLSYYYELKRIAKDNKNNGSPKLSGECKNKLSTYLVGSFSNKASNLSGDFY